MLHVTHLNLISNTTNPPIHVTVASMQMGTVTIVTEVCLIELDRLRMSMSGLLELGLPRQLGLE